MQHTQNSGEEHEQEASALLLPERVQAFDQRITDERFVHTLEKEKLLSRRECKRVGFLLGVLSYPDAERLFTAKYQCCEGETFRHIQQEVSDALEQFLGADEQSLPLHSEHLRRTLLPVEGMLESIRRRESVEVDSHLEIGKQILRTRERVGLALGGGGLWGIAHIGVLEELQKAGIPLNLITGASMGALVGGLATAYINEHGELSEEGIAYMKKVAENIRTLDQLAEKRGDVTVLPLDKLLSPGGEDDKTYKELMGKTPAAPYWAQVSEHHGRFRPTRKEIFLTSDRMEDIMGVQRIAAASAALKPKFGLSPVPLEGKTYSDDTSVARKSTSAGARKLRTEGATMVIGVPVGFIDSDVWKPLQFVQDLCSSTLRYRGDVVIEPKKGRGILSGTRSLTNFGQGLFLRPQKFAQTAAEIDGVKKIPIPVGEFIEQGKKATKEALPDIYAELGLRRLGVSFDP